MSFATVVHIHRVEPHPNASRLDLVTVAFPVGRCGDKSYRTLVTGKHYRSGDMGVWFAPGCTIPGWLAHNLWLVGKKRAEGRFEVRERELRGWLSPGLFSGQWYINDGSEESATRYAEMEAAGMDALDGYIAWPYWKSSWKAGMHVDDDLEVLAVPQRIAIPA
jgi:hypothetical protein